MKFVKGFFSSILTIVLTFVIITFVLVLGFSKFLSVDFLSETFKNIDIVSILVDENGNESEIGKQLYSSFEEMGISKESANKFFADEDIKKVLGETISSIALNKVDPSVEVSFPTKETLSELVNNKLDLFSEVLKIDTSKATTEEINKAVDQYYEKLIGQLSNLVGGEN